MSNSQIDRLRIVASANDLVIKNIEQGALRFSMEPAIKTLSNQMKLDFGPGKNENLSDLLRTQRMLIDFVSTNNLLDSVYLYISGSNYIISSRDSFLSLDRFMDQEWLEKYEALRSDARAQRMMPAHMVSTRYGATANPDDFGNNCLTYVYPITPFTSTFHGALVFNIREDALLELYMGNASEGNLAVFDNKANFLTGVSGADFSYTLQGDDWSSIFSSTSPDSGHLYPAPDKDRLQYTYFRSSDNRFIFLSVQNMSAHMERTTSMQIMSVTFLVFFVPFTAFLVLIVSRRLYSPIGKLVKELETDGRLKLKGEKDTFTALSAAVNELMHEDHHLFSDLSRKKLRDATVFRILSGDVGRDDDEEISAILPNALNICALCMPDTDIATRKQIGNYDSRIRLLIRLIEMEFAAAAIHSTVIRYDENNILIILSIGEIVSDPEGALRARFEAIQPGAQAILGDSVTFAVGSVNEKMSGVRQCFEQAKKAMAYRFIYGLGRILFYDEVYTKAVYFNADERIHYIQYSLNRGEKSESINGIIGLFDDIRKTPYVSFICVSQVLNQLATILIQYSIANNIQLDELVGESAPLYHGLWQLNRTLDEACAYLCNVYGAAIEYQNVGDSNIGDHMSKILDYVHKNYSGNITIDSIALHIGISYSYLRKLFKEATDQNLVDYISRLRINKAKQMLSETNYTIKIVAEMCGYNHERSFSRAFTQSEGITPGKYKALHKKDSNRLISAP